MSRKSKTAKALETAQAEAVEAGREVKKRGFVRKTLSRLMVLGAIGSAVKYFSDSTKGDARRKKVVEVADKAGKKAKELKKG